MGQGSHMRRRLPASAVVAAALFALVLSLTTVSAGADGSARTAAAKPSDQFFGVSSVETPTKADFDRLKAGGIGTYRLGFAWEPIQPQENGPYDFTYFDMVVDRAATAGVQILPYFYGSPSYISSRVSDPPLKNADQKGQWSRFVQAVAGRYGRGGSFWATHPLTPYMPLGDWVIWNEVNLKQYWYSQPRVKSYVTLVSLARQAVHSVDPAGRIVTAGLFRLPATGSGISATDYLSKLYRVPAFKKVVDVVAIHIFAKTPGEMLTTIRKVRGVMNRHRDRGTPIFIDELGWSTGGTGGKIFRTSYKGQARKLSQVYRLLLKNRHRLRIERALWLLIRDLPSNPGSWLEHMGLFDSNGTPKPAWFSLVKVAGGTP